MRIWELSTTSFRPSSLHLRGGLNHATNCSISAQTMGKWGNWMKDNSESNSKLWYRYHDQWLVVGHQFADPSPLFRPFLSVLSHSTSAPHVPRNPIQHHVHTRASTLPKWTFFSVLSFIFNFAFFPNYPHL